MDLLDGLLARVGRDAAARPLLTVLRQEWDEQPGTSSCWLVAGDGSRVGLSVPDDWPRADALALVADRFQDAMIEEAGRLGVEAAWPACGRHPDTHPLRAQVWSGEGWWMCPADDRPVCLIGGWAEGRGRRG